MSTSEEIGETAGHIVMLTIALIGAFFITRAIMAPAPVPDRKSCTTVSYWTPKARCANLDNGGFRRSDIGR